MTAADSTKVIELLREDRKQREKRDTDFREMLGQNLEAIQSTREDVQALSTRLELHQKDDDHTHSILGARLEHLEDRADATGRHDLAQLEQQLARRDESIGKWRDRVWSIVATFLTTATIALVSYYIATK
jgi:uncharacterized protein Yka (UPF0111/DUF47 family)